MPNPYTKLSKKEFNQAYANRKTSTRILQKESEIKRLFDLIFKKQNWGGIRGERRGTGGIFPDDWFRKHIAKAIKGDFDALKDLSRITGRKINDLKDAFEKREDALLETRSNAAKESFPSERKVTPEKPIKTKVKKNESNDKEKLIQITEKVEKNIYKITSNHTGYIRYRVQFWDEKAPLDENGITSLNEAKRIKSQHLKDHPELLPQGRAPYETIEKHIKYNGHNYIVQMTRGSGNDQEIFYKGDISTLDKARKVRDQFITDNPIIINKSKIGTGVNDIEELNKEAKFLYKQGEVDFSTYEPLPSEQKKKIRDKLRN